MSIQQVQNFKKLRAILKELTAFGLNSNQWRISRLRDPGQSDENSFVIYHSQDEEFRLHGSWQKSKTGIKVQALSVVGF